MPIIILISHQ
nr:unnamed protein product [Callosobruchus chinensis]